jgi:hypothetical protein
MHDQTRRVTPGSQASRRRASVRGRGALTVRPFRSWSSFSCENRASWNDGDGWVETCASALTMELLLRILCAGQTKSIKESWSFTPARWNRVIGRSDHRAIGQKRRLLLSKSSTLLQCALHSSALDSAELLLIQVNWMIRLSDRPISRFGKVCAPKSRQKKKSCHTFPQGERCASMPTSH